MVVGSPKVNNLTGRMDVYSRSRDDGTWARVFGTSHVRSGKNQSFGASVDVSARGDVIVVGAPGGVSALGSRFGYAVVYTKSGDTWVETRTLLEHEAPGQSTGTTSLHGSAVSISEDGKTIAIGAPVHRTRQSGIEYYGAVMLWELLNGRWQPTRKLTYATAGYEDKKFDFGASLDLSATGSTLAVGMPKWTTETDIGPVAEGRVVVFQRDANVGWTGYTTQVVEDLERSANVYGNRLGKRFGTSVALSDSGNLLAVGAPGYGEKANAGAVYLFNKLAAGWALIASESRDYAGGLGGQSVALDARGTQLLVGAPGYNSWKGLAVYYTYANGTLTPVNFQAGKTKGLLGTSVAMDGRGEVMAAGAPDVETTEATGVGQVATFDRFTVPGVVTPLQMISRQGVLQVVWRQPAGNEGLTVEYTARAFKTGSVGFSSCQSTTTGCQFVGLLPGAEYRVIISAKNAVGRGEWSGEFGPYVMGSDVLLTNETAAATPAPREWLDLRGPEEEIDPGGSQPTPDPGDGGSQAEQAVTQPVPGVPPGVKVKAGYRTATVTWNAPTDGGDPVTYEVTATPGKKKCVTTGETSCSFSRLATNRAYQFSVVAVNLAGPGASSPATAKRFTQPKVSLRNSATGASIARFATLKVAKTSRVRLAVVGKASSRVCASSGSTVRGLSVGRCRVKVSVTTGARTRAKTLTLTVIS